MSRSPTHWSGGYCGNGCNCLTDTLLGKSYKRPSLRNRLRLAIRFLLRIINAACMLANQFFATLSQENYFTVRCWASVSIQLLFRFRFRIMSHSMSCSLFFVHFCMFFVFQFHFYRKSSNEIFGFLSPFICSLQKKNGFDKGYRIIYCSLHLETME